MPDNWLHTEQPYAPPVENSWLRHSFVPGNARLHTDTAV